MTLAALDDTKSVQQGVHRVHPKTILPSGAGLHLSSPPTPGSRNTPWGFHIRPDQYRTPRTSGLPQGASGCLRTYLPNCRARGHPVDHSICGLIITQLTFLASNVCSN
jgi:hypothetical protein